MVIQATTMGPSNGLVRRLDKWFRITQGIPANLKIGGLTDFSKGPYTMYVQSIKVEDYGRGKAYHWSDKTGSMDSIKAIVGNSTAATTLTAPPPAEELTVAQKWNNLSPGVRIGIYSAGGCVAACIAGLITFCCIKQRRAGRKEQAAYNAKLEQDRLEAENFSIANKDPDALPSSATPNQYASGGATFEKSGQFGNNNSDMSSPPPAYAGMNNNSPRSPVGNDRLNGPLPNGPLPNGPLPMLPLNANGTRSPPPGSQGFQGGAYGENARFNNGPGSMRSNNGSNFNDPRGFNDARSPSNGPGSPRNFHGPPNNFGDMPPRLGTPGSMRSNSGFSGMAPPSPHDFTSNGNNYVPSNGNGPPRLGNGPGSMRSNHSGFSNGNFNNGPPMNNGPPSNYGDGGLRSPNVPIGYADGGLRSPSNFSHPGNFSPRSQSPRVPLAQSPRDYYAPGPAQFGGSSGGNFFNNNPQNGGYSRPGAF